MQKKTSRRTLNMKAVGERVRELIRLQDSSVGCFADRIGVSRNTMYRLTCEGLMPSLQTMVDIGEMLGCSVDFLLGLEMPEDSPAEAYHTAALNILEYREQMTRKQKLLLVCALCGTTTEEEEKMLRYFRGSGKEDVRDGQRKQKLN